MSLKDQTTLRIVFYEGEGAQPLDAPGHFAAVTALLEKGYAVTRVSGEGSVAPVDRASLLVLGRFDGGKPPHAADARDIPLELVPYDSGPDERIREIQMLSPERRVDRLLGRRGGEGG